MEKTMTPNRIWKYVVAFDAYVMRMPKGAKILGVQVQFNEPKMWALVDDQQPLEERRFYTIGTGHDFDYQDGDQHIGTFQLHGGSIVFHVFERTSP